jgi:hypothetical protein
MMWGAKLVLAAPLLLGACAGTINGTAAARLENPVAGRSTEPAALHAAPTAAWRAAPGEWAAGVRYAPTAVVEAQRAPLLRHRLAAEAGSARGAGLHPFGRLQLEYGTLRAGEQAEDRAEATPQPELLRSWGARLDAGVSGQLTRRTYLRLGTGVDRSAGLGTSALSLPDLTRTHVGARAVHRYGRSTRLEAAAQAAHLAFAVPAALIEAEFRTSQELSATTTVTAAAGGGTAWQQEAGTSARPIFAVGATYASAGGARTASGTVDTRPEFDRLDGTLRQRVNVQFAADARVAGETRLATRLQGSGDLPGEEAARRLLAADVSVRTRVGGYWRGEVGLRAFVQRGDSVAGPLAAPSRARLYMGVARRFD